MYVDLLVLADLHGAASVRTLSLKFIVENGKEIVSQVAHFIMSQIFVIGGFYQDGPRTIVADLDNFWHRSAYPS